MINLYKQDGETLYGIKEFLLDSPKDLSDLAEKKVKIGSMAFIISTGDIYILNGSHKWVLIGNESGSGSEGDSSDSELNDFINNVDVNRNGVVDTVELTDF